MSPHRSGPVYHAKAELTFLTTEEGGRRHPVESGYRGQFHYDGRDWDAQHSYPGREAVRPGETVTVLLTFFNPEAHRGRIYPGKEFEIREGRTVVARGRITRVLRLP